MIYCYNDTHVGAPRSLIKGSTNLDEFRIGSYIGSGVVLELSGLISGIISKDNILRRENFIMI
jgi:kynurenine formamidase